MQSPLTPDQDAAARTLTSRLCSTERELRQMQALLMEGRLRTDDRHYWHVGELNFSFFMVACHLNPQEHIRLWHDEAGRLVAYAILGEDPSVDWQVLPDYGWTGIEAEVMDWAESWLVGLRRCDAKRWGGGLVSGSRGENSARIAFLEQHGFRYSGEFAEVNMLRSLEEPILEGALPAGFRVRAPAEAGEIQERAAAHREVWQPWTVGNVSEDDYADFMQLPGYDRGLDVVAVSPAGVIASYVNGWIDPLKRIGDFGPVGARPAFRRQGLTRACLLEGLRRIKQRGMERGCISTGESNLAARRLYESLGFRIVNRYLDYVKPARGQGGPMWQSAPPPLPG